MKTKILILCVALCVSTTLFAEGICGENLTWTFTTADSTLTISGTGAMWDYTSTTQLPWNYYRLQIKRIIIKSGVTTIGNSAFRVCSSLKSITISNSITTIGNSAFYECSSLNSITIPNSVTTIRNFAFYGCSSLNSIAIPNSVTSIEEGTFRECNALNTVTIGSDVTSIGSYAFFNCTNLNSVHYTGSIAQWCNINFYFKPEYSYPLYSNPLYYAPNLYIDSALVTDLVIPEGVDSIKPYAFYGATCITSVTIPNSVTGIGQRAFEKCASLNSVIIGSGITNFEGYIFPYTKLRTFVCLGDSINLKFHAFSSSLDTIVASSSLFDVRKSLWENCPSTCSYIKVIGDTVTDNGLAVIRRSYLTLKTVDLSAASNTELPNGALAGCFTMNSAALPSGLKIIGNRALADCRGLLNISIPASVTTINDSAFINCIAIKTITFDGSSNPSQDVAHYAPTASNQLKRIGNSAFYNCYKLNNLTIPAGVTEIGSSAFASCRSLKSVTLSDNITAISNSLFFHCDSLPQITIPNSVTKIGSKAFYYCANLEHIVLGALVNTIDSAAFGSCGQLKSIVCFSQVPPVLTDREKSLPNGSTTTVYVPCGTYSAYKQAWYWSKTYYTALNGWITESDKKVYLEKFPYQLVVSSQNLEEGDVIVNTEPTCTDNAVITAIPKEGYGFVRWNDGDATNPRSIALTSDTTLVAKFGVACNIQAVSQGDKGKVLGGGKYGYGAVVTLESVPNEGYHFVQWSDNNTENPRSIVVLQDSTFTAEFAIDTFTVSVESNDNVLGNVTGAGVYDYNSLITISAIANIHYHFSRWNDGNAENPRNILVARDSSFVAIFEIDSCLLQLSSNNTQMGYVNGSGTYSYNSLLELTAVPKIGHHFVQWNDGSVINPRTITLTQDSMFIALFAVDTFMIAVESSDIEMGIVNGSGKYVYDNSVQIEAIPNEGFEFVKWNDNVTLNPRMILVTQDSLFTAEFQKAQTPIQLVSVLDGVFVSEGQIIVEGYEDEMIYIYNSVGQCISITRNNTTSVLRIRVPYSGVYLVKIANKVLKVII